MKKHLFDDLTESFQQAGEIIRGERAPPREFFVDGSSIQGVPKQTPIESGEVCSSASS
jgi:putative transcriptional regulator